MLTPAAAEAAIRSQVPRLAIQSVELRAATGRVLQEVICAERDQPPFNRVSMDGIALASSSGLQSFRIAGTQAAGASPLTLAEPGDCIEAMTGAMLPIGCDCVIPVERIEVANGVAKLVDGATPLPWLNVHRRGVDCRAGAEVLRAGVKLGSPEVAVLASAGKTHVQVASSPRIVVISTGDELIEPGEPLSDWQIRRSNVYAVMAALRSRGYDQVSDDHIADDEAALRVRLAHHLRAADVLILSGGVSMGKFDFVPKIMAELGVKTIFHKVAQRPGKPMWFGVHADGKAVYALPGNPVSTLVCLTRFVFPGLDAAAGVALSAEPILALGDSCKPSADLTLFMPVRLTGAPSTAQPKPTQGSGDFTSLLGTEGFIELPPGDRLAERGALVKFYRW
jgi:molybdopterin molybdotransferase